MHGRPARASIDAAMALMAEQGFNATSMAQIAEAVGQPVDDVIREMGSKESIVLSVSADMLAAVVDALPEFDTQSAVAGALLAAHCEVLGDIIAGTGPITSECMRHMGVLLMFTPELQAKSKEHRTKLLSVTLADRLGLAPDDRAIRYELTLWSAVLAATYLGVLDRKGQFDPEMDVRTPEGMRDRLIRAFRIVIGQ